MESSLANDISRHPDVRHEILSHQRSQHVSDLKHEFLQKSATETANIQDEKLLEIGPTQLPVEPRISVINGGGTSGQHFRYDYEAYR